MKKNIVIVLLAICVIGLGGFLVYDKVLKEEKIVEKENEEDKNKTEEQSNSNNESNLKNAISDVSQFPQKSDDSVIYSVTLENLTKDSTWEVDLEENFKDIKYKTNDIEYSVSCSAYDENLSQCAVIEFKFEDFSKGVTYRTDGGCGDGTYVLLTDDYLIEQKISGCGEGGPINVLDKKGNQVFHVDSSVAYYFSDSYEEGFDTTIAVIDNVLYYISYNEEDFFNSSSGDLYFNSLDLSNLKLNKIQTFNAYPAGLA